MARCYGFLLELLVMKPCTVRWWVTSMIRSTWMHRTLAAQTLDQLVIVWSAHKWRTAVLMSNHRQILLIEQSSDKMGVLVDEKRVLECFSILGEPCVLNALFSTRSRFNWWCEHLYKKLSGLRWHSVAYLHLNWWVRILVFIGDKHFPIIASLEEVTASQEVKEEATGREYVCLFWEWSSFEHFRCYIAGRAAFKSCFSTIVSSASQTKVTNTDLEFLLVQN